MSEQTRLKTGALGAVGITFLVVGAAAPLTVMTGVPPLAISIGGIGPPLGYLATGLVLAVFAVGLTAMTRHTRGAGAFYSYITLSLGRPIGAASGMLAVFAYNALQIGTYGLLAYFLHHRGVAGARVAMASSALGAVLLALILGVMVDKIALLTGAEPATNTALVVVVPMVLAAGLVWAPTLKARKPQAYARSGGGEEARHMEAAVAPTVAAEATA